MQQNIRYTGLANNPSDYDSPDGQLATAIGLVNEDGGLKGVQQPGVVSRALGNREILYRHNTAYYRHYIVLEKDRWQTNYLKWIDEKYLTGDYTQQEINNHLVEITHEIGKVEQVTAVGNTLIVLSNTGTHYIYWKDAYTYLGQKPPEVEIQFGVSGCHSANYLGLFASSNHRGEGYAAFCETSNDIIYMLVQTHAVIRQANRFYAPFNICYCYRMFDGSMFMHSAPVFMPITNNLQINYVWWFPGTDGNRYAIDNSSASAEVGVSGTYPVDSDSGNTYRFRYQPNNVTLRYKAVCNDINKLKDGWKDIIKSVDIFITPPILRESMELKNQSENYEVIPKSNHYADYRVDVKQNKEIISSINYHYDLYDSSKVVGFTGLQSLTDEQYLDKIKSSSTFYKIASFDLSKEELKLDTWADVPMTTGILETLASQEQLKIDYRTHNSLCPNYNNGVSNSSMFDYNNRINISGVNNILYDGFDISTMIPYDSRTAGTTDVVTITEARVYIDTNDGMKVAVRDMSDNGGRKCWLVSLADIPLYYPDNRAKWLYLKVIYPTIPGGYTWLRFKMDTAPNLNGAYTKGGIFKSLLINDPSNYIEEAPSAPMDKDNIENTRNKVYTSEVENPFLFPQNSTNTVSQGDIIATVAVTKALSQGQFGQFPLYAFTTEGVWALEVAADGTYSAMHPVSRDVCTNVASITQIDNAVLFVTDRGIMLLQGSDTVCITDGILGDAPFDPATLPHLDEVANDINGYHVANSPMTHDFLAGCRMIYDYMHQHIIVFNPEMTSPDGRREYAKYPYAHVYSLKSKLWGMMQSDLASTVNSYPDALAITRDRQLVSFASSEEQSVKGLLVTRPFKLGSPDAYKTIHNVVQRGVFHKGNVKTLLYGSRDLYNWHLVGSSVDHWLRGLRGTPFKYFRIALLTNLTPGESVSAVTVDFEPKETNKLH
jgi:hypothetical protein